MNKIIIIGSSKACHNKDIDSENEKEFFKTYKHVFQRVSEFILKYNPKFEFSHMLISTVIQGAHNQRFFAVHLPSLTDFKEGKNSIARFNINLVIKAINWRNIA